jgi:hypothetical protein
MFEKAVQEMFYKKATVPQDLPWHSNKPAGLLVEAVSRRKDAGKAIRQKKSAAVSRPCVKS